MPIEALIGEVRNGRLYILAEENRADTRGVLVAPAQMVTPDKINSMARHGRGLICLALPEGRTETLGLELMPKRNSTHQGIDFTTSIEARSGVTTGISASDRARTIAAAIDPKSAASSLVSPGHVFPIIARAGGVLARTGFAEAAVDLSRLAGLNESAVICDVLRDDGGLASLSELEELAGLLEIGFGTIEDLVAFRARNDRLIERVAQTQFTSRYGGDWQAHSYRNRIDASEYLVLTKGQPLHGTPTLVRMHVMAPLADAFGEPGDRAGLIRRAMTAIANEGTGVIVVINRADTTLLSELMRQHARGLKEPFYSPALRDFGIGAQILVDLGIDQILLLTNSSPQPVAVQGYGLNIVGQRPL